MKLAKSSMNVISFCLFFFVSGQQLRAAVPMVVPKEVTHARISQKLEELRVMLNAQKDQLSNPAVWRNIFNVLRVLIALGVFAGVGYVAAKKAFDDDTVYTPPMYQPRVAVSQPMMPAARPIPVAMPPSYNYAVMKAFFDRIGTIRSPQYLDVLMPQLVDKYGPADKVNIDGYSLIGAILGANLSDFNKAAIIRQLKDDWRVTPTLNDRQKAQQLGKQMVIDAVNN